MNNCLRNTLTPKKKTEEEPKSQTKKGIPKEEPKSPDRKGVKKDTAVLEKERATSEPAREGKRIFNNCSFDSMLV